MSTTTNTEVAQFPTPAPSKLSELATDIKAKHDALIGATRNAVQRAITVGELLNEAKNITGGEHGQWLVWLKTTGVPERTAQRYMKLAKPENKQKILDQIKSDTMSDLELTINGALGLVSGGGNKNVSDTYDTAEKKLIKKLKDLAPDAADAAATETIKKLKETVETMTKAAASAAKKAKTA